MREFLKRLGLCIVYPIGMALAFSLIVLLMYCIATYNWVAITCWIVFAFVGIPVLIAAVKQFVNWLFIEPFKSKKEV